MAEERHTRRRPAASDAAATEAAVTGHVEGAVGDAAVAVAAAPAPPVPPAADAPDAPDSQRWPKAVLIARSADVLGVPVRVARGVLAELPDEVSLKSARSRIEDFLANPVGSPAEDEEA